MYSLYYSWAYLSTDFWSIDLAEHGSSGPCLTQPEASGGDPSCAGVTSRSSSEAPESVGRRLQVSPSDNFGGPSNAFGVPFRCLWRRCAASLGLRTAAVAFGAQWILISIWVDVIWNLVSATGPGTELLWIMRIHLYLEPFQGAIAELELPFTHIVKFLSFCLKVPLYRPCLHWWMAWITEVKS